MSSGAPEEPAQAPLPQAELPAGNQPTLCDPHGITLAGLRVLLAEDNPVNRVLAQATLLQWGMVVTLAEDGEEAVEAVASADALGQPIQLVLMDLQMPRMDGLEATRLLRRTHSDKRLPILAVTASVQQSDRDAAAAAGMNGFLAKPIDSQALRLMLAQVLPSSADPAP